MILSSLSVVSPGNGGIGSSEIHAFRLLMIASWIGGAVFWCDIHLLMDRRSDAGRAEQPRWCVCICRNYFISSRIIVTYFPFSVPVCFVLLFTLITFVRK